MGVEPQQTGPQNRKTVDRFLVHHGDAGGTFHPRTVSSQAPHTAHRLATGQPGTGRGTVHHGHEHDRRRSEEKVSSVCLSVVGTRLPNAAIVAILCCWGVADPDVGHIVAM